MSANRRGLIWRCAVPHNGVLGDCASRGKTFDADSASKRSAKSEPHSTEYTTAKNKRLVGLLSTDGSNSPQRASYAMRKECDQNICLWEPRLPFIAPSTYPVC